MKLTLNSITALDRYFMYFESEHIAKDLAYICMKRI